MEKKLSPEQVMDIAKVCHEVNRVFCEYLGDLSQLKWEDAPAWQQASAYEGVEFHATGEMTPEQTHENWLKSKEADGWVYGEVKDAEKKTHPCMVPYNELPKEQQFKDTLFKTVVESILK